MLARISTAPLAFILAVTLPLHGQDQPPSVDASGNDRNGSASSYELQHGGPGRQPAGGERPSLKPAAAGSAS